NCRLVALLPRLVGLPSRAPIERAAQFRVTQQTCPPLLMPQRDVDNLPIGLGGLHLFVYPRPPPFPLAAQALVRDINQRVGSSCVEIEKATATGAEVLDHRANPAAGRAA